MASRPSEFSERVPKPGIWRHYKGGEYLVLGTVILSNTGHEGALSVLYESLCPDKAPPSTTLRVRTLLGEDGWSTPTADGQARFVYVGEAPLHHRSGPNTPNPDAAAQIAAATTPAITAEGTAEGTAEDATESTSKTMRGPAHDGAGSDGRLAHDRSDITPAIVTFSGQWSFMSNFTRSRITYEGIEYPSIEHAFAAAKTYQPAERRRIAAATTSGAAKRLGRAVELRRDWESVKDSVMRELLLLKFADPALAQQLASTGSARLIEGNTWHDQYWGDCSCPRHKATPGLNRLGELLSDVRRTLNHPRSHTVVRHL